LDGIDWRIEVILYEVKDNLWIEGQECKFGWKDGNNTYKKTFEPAE